jgi:hypothetical protein
MTSSPLPYENLVTPRARRLKTIGSLLLVVIVGMALYGVLGLMPGIQRTAALHRVEYLARVAGPDNQPTGVTAETVREKRLKRSLKLQVAVAQLYWGVCGLLLCGALLIAWLYFREISRSFIAQRRALVSETITRARKDE